MSTMIETTAGAAEQPVELKTLEAALADATARLDEGQARATVLTRRKAELANLIRDASPKDAEKLRRERDEVTSALVHLPDDVVALAQAYVNALLAWAGCLYPWAARVRSEAIEQWDGPFSEYVRVRAKFAPDVPALGRLQPDAEQAARADAARRWQQLAPIKAAYEAAESDMSTVTVRLRQRFGDGVQGCVVPEHAISLWLQTVRRHISRQVQPALGGIGTSLRPLSIGTPNL
jgi:hypothetical protein